MSRLKIDMTSLGGILFGLIALVSGFLLEGGRSGALIEIPAAIIVFGGTFAAVAVSSSIEDIRRLPHYLALAFTRHPFDPVALINEIVGYAEVYRKNGSNPLALEPFIKDSHDNIIRKGLQLIVDNTDHQLLSEQLETELYAESQDLDIGANMLEMAGGFAPTIRIIGTVMGLVHVLGSLDGGASALAASIGMAFIATLYGVASANIGWLPLSQKLHSYADHTRVLHQMAIEGLLMIDQGQSKLLVNERLRSHIHNLSETGNTEPLSMTGGR